MIMSTKKIAIVTGGSRGLGRSAALHLARKGVDLVITYRAQKGEADRVIGEIHQAGGRAVALPLDTGDIPRFAAFAEELRRTLDLVWGRSSFDYLINNAGSLLHRSFEETTEDDFDAMLDVNLKGVFFLTQALLPLIGQDGRILNVSSGLARFATPGYAAYATTKGAVETLTRYLARELGPRGIAVNVIAPGAIETDLGGGVVRDNPELNRMIAAATAMGRVGLPDDIGQAIAGLVVEVSPWMTGQRIEVSGGQNL
jgi:NAD(P)-dependent dehydrogenase (short-subunit alcohol dehydrogenase family)